MRKQAWAGYPTASVKGDDGKAKDSLLWGRELFVVGNAVGGKVPVEVPKALPSASSDPSSSILRGWIKESELLDEPILEVVFVDIGQGDGCMLVMPDGRRMLVDAGEGDNMLRWLKWRFGDFTVGPPFEIVMSHSDMDHYLGFKPLFGDDAFRASVVYHNGLVERVGEEILGERVEHAGKSYCVDLIEDDQALNAIIEDEELVGGKLFPKLLRQARDQVDAFKAVGLQLGDTTRKYLPGYEANKPVSIEILGPVREDANGQPGLRWFGDDGKTKNGHSVVLRLKMGKVSLLLGGDLNVPSQGLLLQHHGNAQKLRCDIAKACHHGSADFSDLFLKAVNPIATIVSSGDEEPHAHPRPDAIGTFGLCGRGKRPLIFSTELARSAAERIKYPYKFRRELADIFNEYAEAFKAENEAKAEKARKKFDKKLLDIVRSISVYGAINVRTDGEKALIAYMLEVPKASKKWDLYKLEPGGNGELEFVSKYEMA
jgi:beta-lactamase superfamily II metal-dependent hydrolase